MIGPFPENGFESDGLTGCPDYILGCDLRPAGHWHDYAYTIGGDEMDRERADRDFLVNLGICGLANTGSKVAAAKWAAAKAIYRRVRFWGIRHFTYDQPPSGLRRVALYLQCAITRYFGH